ncbi:hypothetical protein KR067_013450, partial [Drosophila pandora]
RMELLAAVAGVRLAHKTQLTRNLNIGECTFWTDSKTVLSWLTMDPRKFHAFVMHRIGGIMETTSAAQWRWISTHENVADMASKFIAKPNLEQWTSGPAFLKRPNDRWPNHQPSLPPENDNNELKKVVLVTKVYRPVLLKLNIESFSMWKRLYRATATFIMYVKNLKAKCRGETITKTLSDEIIMQGKNLLYKKVVKEELKNVDFNNLTIKYDEIKWNFNPPGAPHMGGAWQRLIRSIKIVLKSISPNYSFNDESLRNAMMNAEYVINSRPLTFVSLDANDDDALTRNHLLLGSADGYKPIVTKDSDARQRWHQTNEVADLFWKRWVKEYIPIITRRSKWFPKRPPLAIGDVVILVDESLPRNLWPKGRIIGVATAKDGQVRSATVKTHYGTMVRPATKIAVLDVK